jgi:DNA-binding IclR family transcriptional regulator
VYRNAVNILLIFHFLYRIVVYFPRLQTPAITTHSPKFKGKPMNKKDKAEPRGGIQVIERAARILRALKSAKTGMSLGQIADSVDLPRSTVQRIVGALMNERFVISGQNGRHIWLGPELVDLADQSRTNIIEVCRLILTELVNDTGETADLSVLRGAAMIFLDQIPGVHRLRTVSSVGDAFPLTTTANGLASLGLMTEEKALTLAQNEWNRQAMSPDEAQFKARLANVRKTGLAYDLGAHTPEVSAVGVAFRDRAGRIYAISVPVPSSRFDDVKEIVEVSLKKTRTHAERLIAKV